MLLSLHIFNFFSENQLLNSCPHASGFPPVLYLGLWSNAISSEKPSLTALMLSIIALYPLTPLCLRSILLLFIIILAYYICTCLSVLWFLHWILSSKMAKMTVFQTLLLLPLCWEQMPGTWQGLTYFWKNYWVHHAGHRQSGDSMWGPTTICAPVHIFSPGLEINKKSIWKIPE